ncbi:MAG: M16 family metallopeptidase [Candidatus Caccovivens sp.]
MIKKKEYKNGAILLYRKRKRKHTSVSAGFVFGGNIRDNYPEPTAHFCEHMFFNETKHKNKAMLKIACQQIFSMENGSTSLFNTNIVFCRSNKVIENCFSLASEMLLETKFNKKYIESEKGVIKQELARKLARQEAIIGSSVNRTLTTKYNSDTSVLGNYNEISNINAKILKKFVKDIFISQNFIISIEGGISYHRAKKLAEKYFINRLKSNPNFKSDKNVIVPIDKPGNLNVEKYPFQRAICSIYIKIDTELETDKNRNILSMITRLCNGLNGEFLSKLREKGLVYSSNICSSNVPSNHSLEIIINSTVQNINACINETGKLFNKLRTIPFTPKQIEIVKEKCLIAEDEQTQSSIFPCKLTRNYLTYGDRIFEKNANKKNKKLFHSLTPTDIQDFCAQILSKPENLYVTINSDADTSKFYTYEQMQDILIRNKKVKYVPTNEKTDSEKE